MGLDLELLKPFRVSAVANNAIERSGAPGRVWQEHACRKLHPVLQYLPAKLAECIGENMQDELGFPDTQDPAKWSVSELNDILRRHVVPDSMAARCTLSGSLSGSPGGAEE